MKKENPDYSSEESESPVNNKKTGLERKTTFGS